MQRGSIPLPKGLDGLQGETRAANNYFTVIKTQK